MLLTLLWNFWVLKPVNTNMVCSQASLELAVFIFMASSSEMLEEINYTTTCKNPEVP
jgi:hypothetical protein